MAELIKDAFAGVLILGVWLWGWHPGIIFVLWLSGVIWIYGIAESLRRGAS